MSDDRYDEEARIILLDQASGFLAFTQRMRSEVDPAASLHEMQFLYQRYCGWDGRAAPTHDVVTGRRRAS